jgi:hypothetical protein
MQCCGRLTAARAGGSIDLQVSVTDEAPAVVSAPAARDSIPGTPAELSPRAPLRWLRFQLTDSGIGVDPGAWLLQQSMRRARFVLRLRIALAANLERIFMPFVQARMHPCTHARKLRARW